MKTKYKHVHFHKLAHSHWVVQRNEIETTVGFLQSYLSDRSWFFSSNIGISCSVHEVRRQIVYLREIADFMGQLNKEAKA